MSSQHSYIPQSILQQAGSYNHARYQYALKLFAEASSKAKKDMPTCCEGWAVSDVVEHATLVMAMVDQIDGKSPNIVAESDPTSLAIQHAEWIGDRWTEGNLETTVQTPFGETTVDAFLGIIWVDTLTHIWDIADASDIDHGISQAMAEEAYEVMKPREKSLRGPERFGPAVETTSEDAVERYIAFAGRTSVRG